MFGWRGNGNKNGIETYENRKEWESWGQFSHTSIQRTTQQLYLQDNLAICAFVLLS